MTIDNFNINDIICIYLQYVFIYNEDGDGDGKWGKLAVELA